MDRLVEVDSVDPAIVTSLARELKRAGGMIEDEPELEQVSAKEDKE